MSDDYDIRHNFQIVNGKTFAVAILGDCHGVGITFYDLPNDNYSDVMLTILTEDDDNWFISEHGVFNSYWLPSLQMLLAFVEKWLNENFERYVWGWKKKNG